MAPPPVPARTRLARARRIRRSVVACGIAAFLAAWGGIYVQMRAGRDPALGAGTSAAVAQTSSDTSSSGDDTSTTSDDTSGSSDDTTSASDADDSSSTSSSAPAVTTRSS